MGKKGGMFLGFIVAAATIWFPAGLIWWFFKSRWDFGTIISWIALIITVGIPVVTGLKAGASYAPVWKIIIKPFLMSVIIPIQVLIIGGLIYCLINNFVLFLFMIFVFGLFAEPVTEIIIKI